MMAKGKAGTQSGKPGAVDRAQLEADIKTLASHWNLGPEQIRFMWSDSKRSAPAARAYRAIASSLQPRVEIASCKPGLDCPSLASALNVVAAPQPAIPASIHKAIDLLLQLQDRLLPTLGITRPPRNKGSGMGQRGREASRVYLDPEGRTP